MYSGYTDETDAEPRARELAERAVAAGLTVLEGWELHRHNPPSAASKCGGVLRGTVVTCCKAFWNYRTSFWDAAESKSRNISFLALLLQVHLRAVPYE